MDLDEQVKRHETRVLCRVSTSYRTACPYRGCEFGTFSRHDIRRRVFYGVDGTSIQSWLVRWKCCSCRRTFTDYPPFALPYKRYAKPTVFAESIEYCHNDKASYRSTTRVNSICPSTLWRWLSWLSSLADEANRAMKMMMNTVPTSEFQLHRKVWMTLPGKSRSQSRNEALNHGYRSAALFTVFEASKFPEFATQHCTGQRSILREFDSS